MDDQLDVAALVNKAIKEARRDFPKVNVLIAGRTGVGKSTLINSVFRGDFAATGQGKPVTKHTRKISKKGVPLAIWDTRGLELDDFLNTRNELITLVKKRAASEKAKRHIHVAWLCIAEDGRRIEKAEIDLSGALAKHMPVLGAITKARSDDGFRAEVQRLLPKTKNVIRVRAKAETLDDGHSLTPMGLDELVEATDELLPEAFQHAFIAAQKVSLRKKNKQAHVAVAAAVATASAVGASPIPFSDAGPLVLIQIGMLARITAVYGLDPNREFLTVLLASMVGTSATAVGGRLIVTNLLKVIPGAGSVVGGAIAAGTAGALTAALGETYISTLDALYSKVDGAPPTTDDVRREFGKRLKQ